MAARLALLCPGQGGQHPGMFDLALGDPATAAAVAGWGVDACTGLSPDALYDNRLAQPLVVAATLAMWEAVRAVLPRPALVAGYSIGELAAYGVAGALAPAEVIRLAHSRAVLMDACVEPGQAHGMAAVSGLDAGTLRSLLPAHALHVAIENGESSFIVAGLKDALPELTAQVERLGQHVTPLPVTVASHTPFMQPAARAFGPVLQAAPWSQQAAPVLSGASANVVYDAKDGIWALTRQMEETIRWSACMDALAEAGVTVALELGPGAALSRMLRERHAHMDSRSASEFRSLAGLCAWLGRRLGA